MRVWRFAMIASKDGHPANVTQLDKFKQAARALECDEDEEAFKRSLRKVAKAKQVKPK
jgi:hypothetical protein